MSEKVVIYFFVFLGSTIASFIPLLWGAGFLSFSSVIFSAIGGALGLWLGFQFTRN